MNGRVGTQQGVFWDLAEIFCLIPVSFFGFVCSSNFDFLEFCHRNCLSDSHCHFNIALRKCILCPIIFGWQMVPMTTASTLEWCEMILLTAGCFISWQQWMTSKDKSGGRKKFCVRISLILELKCSFSVLFSKCLILTYFFLQCPWSLRTFARQISFHWRQDSPY